MTESLLRPNVSHLRDLLRCSSALSHRGVVEILCVVLSGVITPDTARES